MDRLSFDLKFLIWAYSLPVEKFSCVLRELKAEDEMQKYITDEFPSERKRDGNLTPCLIGLHPPVLERFVHYTPMGYQQTEAFYGNLSTIYSRINQYLKHLYHNDHQHPYIPM